MPHQYRIDALPAFQNNYLWLLQDNAHAILIDPGDADACIRALEKYQLQLDGVLITHHHNDHIGGLADIRKRFNCPIYGPEDPRIEFITHVLTEGDQVEWRSFRFDVWHTPGHTNSHIIYWNPTQNHLFCGDMLFGAGCGRNMEGQVGDLYRSLQRIAALAEHTEFFCAHEYTLQNLHFALHIEPDNPMLLQRFDQVTKMREAGIPSIPSNIKIELATNPFLRSHLSPIRKKLDAMKENPDIQNFLKKFTLQTEDEYYFALMRGWKNIYV